MEYIIYCDESKGDGDKYGDFYGGCIIPTKYWNDVSLALNLKKQELNLFGELKWTKVTENYLEKYIDIIHLFFDFVREGKIKVRIMFRKTCDMPTIAHNNDLKYFKLYYQFIKHAFGLMEMIDGGQEIFLRVYFDMLPDTKAKCDQFKEYIFKMPRTKDFKNSDIFIRKDDIAEVISHDHVILQCIDVILGSMFFRLNELHKAIPDGKKRRGKRTVAKDNLYKTINNEIRTIIPNFNIGITTGAHGYEVPSRDLPYSHWQFKPN